MSPCEGVDNAIAAPRPSEAARTAWWPWIASLAIFLLWVIGGSTFVPGFYEQVVVREFLGRFGETIHRPQPLLFYCPHLLHKFFPWSALLVVLGIVNFSLRKLDGLNPSSLKARFWARISPETWWLICWSVGGLIVMSIIPSKRVDRIFPIIPPLCLLLAAQLNGLTPNERLRSGVIKSTMVALVVSILFASGYSGFKVFTGYRDHRNALVLFGRAVRAQAAARQWRYEVVKSNDEGLLLYLETLHFIDSDSATSEWNRGELDALVVSEKNAPDLLRQLHDAALADLKSSPRPDQTDNYVLIVR